ncbi:cytochrome c3 family protein [Mesorhizobium sp. B2-7-3]|uniref:cytochrome c3 family protein n=1 Tax=Mesorhizobium sp. B2-7-3 TaxID=2589907 RepID=UPI00112764F3|nr:cytochrome c3 family protein [Mesorhizobium sp. B2-7-3]TPJ14351.1 cytochrome c3 family protein [Mesorhizobium sp. B2-7-3]
MPQIFRPGANGVARFVLWGGLAGLVALVGLASVAPRVNWSTFVARANAQPVPFSHKHHVGQLGIDCRYCHNSVEVSSSAGLPATEVCMTCHSQLWTNADMLAPVRQSLATGNPLRWHRVNRVADFVFFNHSIHVNKGVACVTCHGHVEEMPLMRKSEPLDMEWCLGCHRDPKDNLRPPHAVFSTDWTPPPNVEEMRAKLIKLLNIQPHTMTDCYVCHR